MNPMKLVANGQSFCRLCQVNFCSLSAFLDVGLFSTRLFCTFEVRILLGKSPGLGSRVTNLKMADLRVTL